MKTIYSTLFEKGQHSFSLQSLMRTLLLCFFIAAATNGQAHEVDNIDYDLYSDGTAWVADGRKAQGDVTIPSKIEVDGKEYPVVGIRTYAFHANRSITSVTLPDNLKYIKDEAFAWCSNLENINNIPKHIENLGETGAVFLGTKFLTNGIKNEFFVFSDWLIKYTPQGETAKVTVPEGIFGISAYALTDADNTVVLPKSLRAASVLAFNSNLKHIDTGDNPVYAYKDGILFCEGTATFYKNSRLLKDEVSVDGMWADVILSNAVKNGVLLIPGKVETAGNVVKTVGGVRKGDLPGLTCEKLIVDEGVKYIAGDAFRNFEPLQYVDLPSTLINIGDGAFAKIESLVCRMPQPMEVPYYFTYYIKEFNSKVYVPKALLDTYKTTESYWKIIPAENFYQIEGNVPESGILASVKPIESVGKATVKAIYTLNGTKVNSLQHGINIVKMSDGTVRKVMINGYKNR